MNHKRRKPRRKVRCRLCTDARWGNSAKMEGRHPDEQRARDSEREQRDIMDGGH